MDRCEECQFDYDALSPGAVPGALRSLGGRFAMRISNERADPTIGLTIRTRPGPKTWSALEYACHLRDVFLTQRERVYLALVEDCPSFAPMYREERAILARYAPRSPTMSAASSRWRPSCSPGRFEGLDEAPVAAALHLQLSRSPGAHRALARAPRRPRGRAPPARRRRSPAVSRRDLAVGSGNTGPRAHPTS